MNVMGRKSCVANLLWGFALAILPSIAWGQAFVWQLPPADYTLIQALGDDFFQIYKGNSFGIIRADGTEIVPIEYDEITGFYEHKALILRTENGKKRIGGYLTDEGDFVFFKQAFYTLNGQAYYSDGLLSVSDDRGRLGYINESGVAAVGFNSSFTKIKPFSYGYAAVFEGNKYSLINKEGEKVKFIIGFGEVQGGTNVYNGVAIIWDTDGNFYSYNVSDNQCNSIRKPTNLRLDYLYCLASISGRPQAVPYVQLPIGEKGISASMMPNGLYGFKIDNQQVLPGQFSSATSLTSNLYAVKLNGKMGILRLIEDGRPFQLNLSKKDISYSAGGKAECEFYIQKPESWISENLEVSVIDDGTGQEMKAVTEGQSYRFDVYPKNKKQSFFVRVSSEGLLLLEERATYTFNRIDPTLRISIAVASDIANKDNQIPVTAIISNPSEEAVTATVHLTGSSAFVEKHTTLTIPAKGSERIQSCFVIMKDESNQFVKVTTSKGGSATKSGLNFESYN